MDLDYSEKGYVKVLMIKYENKVMGRYMKLPLEIIPQEIIQQYNLRNLVHNGF